MSALMRGPERRQEILDGHALAVVGIDEARLHLAIGGNDEGGGNGNSQVSLPCERDTSQPARVISSCISCPTQKARLRESA